MATLSQKEKLQALIDAGQLTERAVRRYLMSHDELLALLKSEQGQEVADDLSRVLRAINRGRPQRA